MMAALLLGAAITFRAGPLTSIRVEIGAGDVSVTGEARADVVIDAHGATATAEGDRIVVRSADADGPPNRGARSRVEMRVPTGVALESIKIVDGELTLKGLRGTVAADVRQGQISASGVSGVVRLETGFGDVVVERAELRPGGLLRLRAFNGNVRLALSSYPTNARVLALTFNGTIESDLPLARRESFGPKFAEGTFGTGDPLISIDSVTGNIAITAAAASPRR
jgi:hypothetical protein